MNSNILLLIGRKIKDIRIQKKIKLIDLAGMAKISKGLLSQIENNRTIPSLPVLLQIINLLEVDYSSFFEGIENQTSTQVIFKRKEDYSMIEKEDAVGFQYLSILSENIGNVSFQFNILELKPDARRDKVVTNGYTYIFMLTGKVEYTVGKNSFRLNKGDSLFFNGAIPHVPSNNSGTIAKLFVLYMLSS